MRRTDIIVIVLALATLPFLYSAFWGPNHRGTDASVQVANEKPQQFSLLRDHTLSVEGSLGESLIRIKNGKVAFIQSPCKNKQCIHKGWLSKNGEASACLPNRISLSVIGQSLSRYDSINF